MFLPEACCLWPAAENQVSAARSKTSFYRGLQQTKTLCRDLEFETAGYAQQIDRETTEFCKERGGATRPKLLWEPKRRPNAPQQNEGRRPCLRAYPAVRMREKKEGRAGSSSLGL